VEIGVTFTGRVAAVPVKEGDAVVAGAALVQLEDDEARAALAQAEASLRQALARRAASRRCSARRPTRR
jgi:HlyD family secretion protein